MNHDTILTAATVADAFSASYTDRRMATSPNFCNELVVGLTTEAVGQLISNTVAAAS